MINLETHTHKKKGSYITKKQQIKRHIKKTGDKKTKGALKRLKKRK